MAAGETISSIDSLLGPELDADAEVQSEGEDLYADLQCGEGHAARA